MHSVFKMMSWAPVIGTRTAERPRLGIAEATRHRITPILPTAAAASLALSRITRAVFRKPMADAMMGGFIVGLVLVLQFLLALYVTWFRVEAPDGARTA